MKIIEKPKSMNHVTCGCCSNGCVCFMHRDVPNGLPVKTCDFHGSLAFAPLDKQYRFDYTIQQYVKVPIQRQEQHHA